MTTHPPSPTDTQRSQVTATISGRETLNEIITRYPRTMPVLQQFSLDLCCGGSLTLSTAAARHGLQLDDVLAALGAQVREAEL